MVTAMLRSLVSKGMRHLCEAVAPRFPVHVITDRDGVSKYLSRYYLFGGPRTIPDGSDEPVADRPVNLYLHCFHRGDNDSALHNHPWSWSVSLILSGGYLEERRVATPTGHSVKLRVLLPGDVNVILASDYHRVDLLQKDAWSLFLAGPRTGDSWGFWDRFTGQRIPWRTFIARRRGVPMETITS